VFTAYLPTATMRSLSMMLVILSVLLGITTGFVVSPSSALHVPRPSQTGIQMLFGGGKKASSGKGIVVKVQQKTGFKETEIVLPGKTNLRKALMDNKIDVYPLQVKQTNDNDSLLTCVIMFFLSRGEQ